MSLVLCDKFPERQAVAHFRWSWGEEGNCSSEYQFLLRQQSENMQQAIEFSPLALPPPALTRDERAALMGKCYALEAELTEVRAQMHTLYTETETLRSETRISAAREAAAAQLLKEAQWVRDEAMQALGTVKGELIDSQAENRRLKALLGTDPTLTDEQRSALRRASDVMLPTLPENDVPSPDGAHVVE